MKTELKNRILFFDGTSLVEPELVPELLLRGVPLEKIRVTRVDDEVDAYNSLADDPINTGEAEQLKVDLTWDIPKEFQDLDIESYVLKLAQPLGKEYVSRATEEIENIQRRKLEPLIKTLIFIVEEFKKNGIVYGVGRGSSCASLVLHLIGLHKVDPIKYNIPLTEFFHD